MIEAQIESIYVHLSCILVLRSGGIPLRGGFGRFKLCGFLLLLLTEYPSISCKTIPAIDDTIRCDNRLPTPILRLVRDLFAVPNSGPTHGDTKVLASLPGIMSLTTIKSMIWTINGNDLIGRLCKAFSMTTSQLQHDHHC